MHQRAVFYEPLLPLKQGTQYAHFVVGTLGAPKITVFTLSTAQPMPEHNKSSRLSQKTSILGFKINKLQCELLNVRLVIAIYSINCTVQHPR